MNIAASGWIPGGIATILTVYAVYITFKATKNLKGDLKQSIILMMAALVSYLLMGISVGTFSVIGIDFTSPFWLVLPSLALIGAVLFLIGAKKLFGVLEEVTR